AQTIEASLAQSGHTMKDVAGAHTIGLDLSEQIITLSNPGTVAEGMVVTVHPMIDLGGGRQLFVGDTVLVGPRGLERLGETRDDIVILD
ncbi:MAG: M24 family metallopeptidase, partial [Rhizobiales bacterium]|nr:M24 family metallopeptidase [Hyphomicrobiales bacterium]